MRRTRIARRLAEQEGERLELTPMIDVTFLLLVFFLCTLRFVTLEAKLAAHLPEDGGPSPAADPETRRIDLVVEVLEPGRRVDAATGGPAVAGRRHAFEGRRVGYRVGPLRSADLDAVEARLAELVRLEPGRGALLRAREGVTHGEVVTPFDRALLAGVGDVSFAARAR